MCVNKPSELSGVEFTAQAKQAPISTVRCRYNAVLFFQIIQKRHPISRPLGRGMGCILWIHHLIYILSEFLLSFMQYLTIWDRVITALHCISYGTYCSYEQAMMWTEVYQSSGEFYSYLYPIISLSTLYFHDSAFSRLPLVVVNIISNRIQTMEQ